MKISIPNNSGHGALRYDEWLPIWENLDAIGEVESTEDNLCLTGSNIEPDNTTSVLLFQNSVDETTAVPTSGRIREEYSILVQNINIIQEIGLSSSNGLLFWVKYFSRRTYKLNINVIKISNEKWNPFQSRW